MVNQGIDQHIVLCLDLQNNFLIKGIVEHIDEYYYLQITQEYNQLVQ